MDVVRTSFCLDAAVQQSLRQASRQLGKTQTRIVQEALTAYLGKVGRPQFQAIGKGEDAGLRAREATRWVRRSRSTPTSRSGSPTRAWWPAQSATAAVCFRSTGISRSSPLRGSSKWLAPIEPDDAAT